MAVTYTIVGLGVIEAADLILGPLHLEAAYPLVVFVVLLGFPIALVMAWVIEITPEGIQRTPAVSPDQLADNAAEGWSRTASILASAGLIVVLAGAYFAFIRATGPVALVANRIAVAPFENRTDDADFEPIGTMAAEWTSDGLSRTGAVEIVPAAVTAVVLNREPVGDLRSRRLDPVEKLAEETGAGIVILGSYYLEHDSLYFQAELVDAARRTVLAAVGSAGSVDEKMRGVEALRQRVMGGLATHLDPRLGNWASAIDPLPSFEAYRAFTDGMEAHLRSRGSAAALEHYLHAVALDSAFVTAKILAASMYLNLGQWQKADSIAGSIAGSETQLTRSDQWHLEYVRARVRGDLEAVYRSVKEGTAVAPALWAQYLGLWAMAVNRPREVVQVLEALDPDRGMVRGFVGYWLWLCVAHHWLGNYREKLEVARRGLQRYPGHPLLVREEITALAALGRVEAVQARADDYVAAYEGESPNPSAVMRDVAATFRDAGSVDEAEWALDHALRWLASRPAEEAESRGHLNRLARVLYAAGRWKEAQVLFLQLRKLDPDRVPIAGYLGTVAARLGDDEEAHRMDQWLAELDRPWLFGENTAWRARIAAVLGERARAVQLFREAHAQGQGFAGMMWPASQDVESLRGYPPFEEFLRPKG